MRAWRLKLINVYNSINSFLVRPRIKLLLLASTFGQRRGRPARRPLKLRQTATSFNWIPVGTKLVRQTKFNNMPTLHLGRPKWQRQRLGRVSSVRLNYRRRRRRRSVARQMFVSPAKPNQTKPNDTQNDDGFYWRANLDVSSAFSALKDDTRKSNWRQIAAFGFT